jgi:hypothetical protein
MSVRAFAVFVLVIGLIAGAYLGLHRTLAPSGQVPAAAVGAEPANLQAEQEAQHHAVNDQRQDAMRQEASRSATRDAQQKAAEAASRAAAQAQGLDKSASPSPSASGPAGQPAGPVPSSCNSYTGNKQVGCTVLIGEGFPISEMTCLDPMWDHESGWRTTAGDPGAAYGIPQANPGDKMASEGSDWQTSAATQVRWGLGYIKGRYGTPCKAWAQWQANGGWY